MAAPTPLDGLIATLPEALSASIVRHGVPGAAFGVWAEGRLSLAAAGLANAATGVAATPESVFQIGSITKSFTATLTMQLVEQGRLDLDAPVLTYLPDLRTADPRALEGITIRHLLAHTSGLDGDLMTDVGRDSDALERFVATLGDVGQLYEPGAFFSYCNLGYNILGRVLEVVGGKPWDELLSLNLLGPLGARRTVVTADGALRHRVAIGHGKAADGGFAVEPHPFAPRSNIASGMTMASCVEDLIAFARLHLDGGLATDGTRLLGGASCAAMRALQAQNTFNDKYRGWGLGWMVLDTGGEAIFGHDGGAAGACAFLRILPNQGAAVALLVNGEAAMGVFRDIGGAALDVLAGAAPPPAPAAPRAIADFDPAPYLGRYTRHGQTIDVSLNDGRLCGALSGDYVGPKPVRFTLARINHDRFVAVEARAHAHFFDFDPTGRAGFLHTTDRVFVRRDRA